MSHIWMSHVTHLNESCHTHEWVMPHTWMSPSTHKTRFISFHAQDAIHSCVWHDVCCSVLQWVMSHTWMSHATHLNESSFKCVTWLIQICDMTYSPEVCRHFTRPSLVMSLGSESWGVCMNQDSCKVPAYFWWISHVTHFESWFIHTPNIRLLSTHNAMVGFHSYVATM